MLIDWNRLESITGNYGCGITLAKNKISFYKGYFFNKKIVVDNPLFKRVTELKLADPFSYSCQNGRMKVDLSTRPKNSEVIFDLAGEFCSFVDKRKVKRLYEVSESLNFKIFLETVGLGFKNNVCDKVTFYFDNFDKTLPKESKKIIDRFMSDFGAKELNYLLPKTDNMYLYIVALDFSAEASKIKFYFLANKNLRNEDLSTMLLGSEYKKYAEEILDTNGWVAYFQIAYSDRGDVTYNFYYTKEKVCD